MTGFHRIYRIVFLITFIELIKIVALLICEDASEF